MEPARMDRVDNQAEDRVPAVEAASPIVHKAREADAVVVVPARAKAGVAAADRDRAAAQAVAVAKIVNFY